MLQRLWKPWFVYQPSRLLRRLFAGSARPAAGFLPLPTSWGAAVVADGQRDLGKSIVATGVFDLAVSEVLARLITPGDSVIDAGANVGYMTTLASAVSGDTGRVISFEPLPVLFQILQRNARELAANYDAAPVDAHQAALGAAPGSAVLQLPPDFAQNDGVARIGAAIVGGTSVTVPVETIDGVLAGGAAAVMKMDVEGYEAEVLRGASETLAGKRIRHIVFEDHAIAGSEVAAMLRAAGYTLYAIGWSVRRPVFRPVEFGVLSKSYEAPNFVATLAPDEFEAKMRPAGWKVFTRLAREKSVTA